MVNNKKQNNCLLLSCVLICLGIGLILTSQALLDYLIQIALTITNNSPLFSLWKTNPAPLLLKLYAYNWTNPEDIYKPHVKPKFQQIGPFVFAEIKEKGNITFNDNDTVSFRQYHTYFFQRDLSVADLSTEITTINPVMTSAAYAAKLKNWGYFMRKGMQVSFSQMKQSLVVTKPFGAYLFEGYDDVFITLSSSLPFMKKPPQDKFGWFYKRNGSTYEGDFNMGTKYHNIGELQTWNFANTTPYYKDECADLTGISAGELYLPHLTKTRVALLSPDLCRPIPLDYDEEVLVGGIHGYKYTAGTTFLDNGTLIPENRCFCPGECLPSGAVNISSCKFGAPGFVSLPNFYGADPFYTESIEGAEPQKEKHEFFIILEPFTGIPLQVAARLQLNLLLQPVKHITTFENIPNVVFPVLWFEEILTIPVYLAVLLKVLLATPTILQMFGALLMAIGLYPFAQCGYRHFMQYKPPTRAAEGNAKELQPLKSQLV